MSTAQVVHYTILDAVVTLATEAGQPVRTLMVWTV